MRRREARAWARNFFLSSVALVGCVFASASSFADEVRTAPIVEMGYTFFSGPAAGSLTGSTGYSFVFKSEAVRGRYRGNVAAGFDFSSGAASLTGSTPTYTMYGGNFVPGFSVFIFREGYFQPFLSINGIAGWNFVKLTGGPAGTEPYTQGLSYGYELSSGVDVRFSRSDASALRLRAGLWTLMSRVAGLSSFQLSGFRFYLGFVY